MIKRIIFDIDDTLLKWRNEFDDIIIETCTEFNINCSNEMFDQILNSILNYEKEDAIISYNEFEDIVEKDLLNKGIKLPAGFIKSWYAKYSCKVDESDKVNATILNYLSKKYSLILLSNWFRDSQENRMEIVDLLKYFKEGYYAGEVHLKPNEEGFIKAMGDSLPEECVMVGDSLSKDIEPAKELGMRTILVDLYFKYNNYNGELINKIEELKNIL